ncbi:MAG: RNA 2',3'-cyclic phosphodiesterase [Nitrososphaerales archaeon]
MRAFIAVDLSSEEVRQGIVKIQKALEPSGADIKSVEPQNLHFTIRFLGEISEVEANDICRVLKELDNPSFKVSFKGLGYFPHARRISVIWVGVEEGGAKLVRLAEQVEEQLKRLNFKPEKRFVPHLTICRVKSGRNKDQLLRAADLYRDISLGTDIVSSIKLKRSQLTPKGPIYTDMLTVSLKASS